MSVDFGGHIRFTYNGTELRVRGKVERKGTNMTSESLTNEDGSTSQIGKPRANELSCDFMDSDEDGNRVDWQNVVFGGRYNIAVIEEDAGNVTHHYNNAFFVGEPRVDELTGTVSGLSIVTPKNGYQNTKG